MTQQAKPWRCFCDIGYYDKWAIQHEDRKGFVEAIHVNTKAEAEYLAEQLNRLDELEESVKWRTDT